MLDNNRENIVIVDTKMLMHIVMSGEPDLEGMMRLVYTKLRDNKITPHKIYWAIDALESSRRRKEIHPIYKEHRKENLKRGSKEAQEKVEKINEYLLKLEKPLEWFGTPAYYPGLEADDIANILTDRYASRYNIILISSDKDWTFNFFLANNKNICQIHFKKGLIHPGNIKDKYEGHTAETLFWSEIYTGVPKENISGIVKFGSTRFLKHWNEAKGDITQFHSIVKNLLKIKKYGMKIPDDISNFEELIKRNKTLTIPVKFKDLNQDELFYFKTLSFFKPKKDKLVFDKVWKECFGKSPNLDNWVHNYYDCIK